MKRYLFLFLIITCYLVSCTEAERPVIATDNVPPGPVSNVEVTNIPGGAILKYQLPEDEDLLYVKAYYSLKEGVKSEVRASLYSDTLTILGFGTEDERTVEIVAVDRSRNESPVVTATIKPLEAPIVTIGNTLRVIPDFGGVHLFWDNINRNEISIILEELDNNSEYNPIEIFYSSMSAGDVASRGMDTLPKLFRAYVQDRWENKSIPIEATISPLFEEEFNHLKFKALLLSGDEPDAWGWTLPNAFDGNLGTGFHTANNSGRWPQTISFDLNLTGKISRIKIWQRQEDWEFRHGNLKRFEIWGTNDGEHMNDWSVWTKMMECESIKPSGLPLGQLSDEDRAAVAAGEEFTCSPDFPAVRYLRLKAIETWSGGDFFHFMEIKVFGQTQ